MSKQTKANLMMVIITTFWGLSYVFMKMGLESMGAFTIITLRFLIAFFITGTIFYKKFRHLSWSVIRSSIILGSFLFLVFLFVTTGVNYTTATNAGFMVSLTVPFVPVINAIIVRQFPERSVQIGLFVTLLGIFLLTMANANSFSLNYGDILCIFAALSYAIHIIVTERLARKHDPITLGVLQLGVTGGIAFLLAMIFETPSLPNSRQAWIAILGLGILCSAIGFVGQAVAQKYTTATLTSLIFALDPVTAAIFAVIFLQEIFTTKHLLGSALVILGIMLAQLNKQSLIQTKKTIRRISLKLQWK